MKLARRWNRAGARSGRAAGPIAIGSSIAVLVLLLIGLWLRTTASTVRPVTRTEEVTAPRAEPAALDAPAAEDVAATRTSATPVVEPNTATVASSPTSARVRLVDADWFEPLPAFCAIARTWGTEGGRSETLPVELVTDATGRARFPDDFARERVTLELVDDEGLARRNSPYGRFTRSELDAAVREGRDLEVAVRTGPTCFFQWTLPTGLSVSSIEARLDVDRPSATTPWPPPGNSALVRLPHAATAHPDLPWVRFGEPATFHGRGWVELRSLDGRWRAGAWIPRVFATVKEPVVVTFEPATRVTARFTWAGEVEEPWVSVQLVERASGSAEGLRRHGGTAGQDRELSISFVEPGAYRLEVRDARWAPFAIDVDVHPGENDLGELRLESRPIAGAIRGTITSTSGSYEGACHVSLSRTPFEHDAFYDHSLDFEPDETGKLVAPIEFEEVTAGEWYLYVHCHDGFEHPGSLFVVSAPNDDVRIVLEDRAVELELDLVDAGTKQSLSSESRVTWGVRGTFDVADGPSVRIAGLPDRPDAIDLVASAPGYRPKHANASAFERVAGTPAKLRATWALERGFGVRVLVVERGSRRPIADATVEVDGAPAGTTNARGELWIDRATVPQRLSAKKDGWVREPSRDVDAEGRFRDDDDLVIEFVRP